MRLGITVVEFEPPALDGEEHGPILNNSFRSKIDLSAKRKGVRITVAQVGIVQL